MSVERILVGLDASQASWTALRWVANRAADGAARVRIVHALEVADTGVFVVRERLAEAAAFVRGTAPGTVVETSVERGFAADALVDDTAEADLVVIGAHRNRRVRSALTGSFPDRIATRAPVPTVVVPDDWTFGSGPIVVGIDAGTAEAALAFGLHEARRTGRSVRLVHAWRVTAPVAARPIALLEDASSADEQSARLVLGTAEREAAHREPAVSVRATLWEGDAGEALAKAGVEASLIVVGRRHRTTIGGELFGSVARETMHRSKTPVVIVPVPVD
ncbi:MULTISPECIES: universal stress protein [unclassified Curtobacterium]|uniref:universal stress protein n=1 Tax=unclassified Curtobacterium TaxID=257496 RepID=UPI000F487ECD|nr:universal stress protein [Curtobacterium sp. JUb34]ROR33434.1 nucleotide-binding universal stress UspA family protein [Curtobacterium sp. JUb34]